ncbi:MAG: glycosyltransferase family 2 protein [Flavobacteriales bacterium]|nr:glycosyltransferase family 2 protein [Flavobacteriales bacterium]
MKLPLISIVVIAYNMERELPRTLYTLLSPYQMGIRNPDIEIIVVDNGSDEPVEIPSHYNNVKLLHCSNPTQSPARAINEGLAEATSDFIGLMVDGARMLSPQLLHFALLAQKLAKYPVVSTIAYHLGPDLQKKSIAKGYNQLEEDKLLDSVPWKVNGYRLFEISALAGSSQFGWFRLIAESSILFMKRKTWVDLDGVDERFKTKGGGLVNLDLYVRTKEMKETQEVSLLGEGTFHQVHGGISTNQEREDASWKVFHDEYVEIRQKLFEMNEKKPIYLGKVRAEHAHMLKVSADNILPLNK